MFHHVLVPLDGSPQADAILPYVSKLARDIDIPMTLLSILEPHAASTSRQVQGAVEPQLHGLADRLRGEGVQAAAVVAGGRPAQEILRVAEGRDCDLIALATSAGHAEGRGILGPVTDKIFHASQIPLLLIPPQSAEALGEGEPPIATLIVPLDGSPPAEAALPYVEDIARKLSAAVLLVRAVPFGGAYVDEKTPLTGELEAGAYLQNVMAKLRGEGLAVQSRVLGGLPLPHIMDLASQTPQSLIVLTSQGHSALTRWFVGSVAEGVVRAARFPVLVIPRQHARRYAAMVAELLAQTPLFAGLAQDDLEHLAETARIRTYQRGEVIVREGETATGCFMIASGRVEVVKGAQSARPTVLATLGAGEFFGEMAVIDDHPRSATVCAIEATECVAIGREDFLETLQRRPKIAVHMLPVLVRRLRQAEARGSER